MQSITPSASSSKSIANTWPEPNKLDRYLIETSSKIRNYYNKLQTFLNKQEKKELSKNIRDTEKFFLRLAKYNPSPSQQEELIDFVNKHGIAESNRMMSSENQDTDSNQNAQTSLSPNDLMERRRLILGTTFPNLNRYTSVFKLNDCLNQIPKIPKATGTTVERSDYLTLTGLAIMARKIILKHFESKIESNAVRAMMKRADQLSKLCLNYAKRAPTKEQQASMDDFLSKKGAKELNPPTSNIPQKERIVNEMDAIIRVLNEAATHEAAGDILFPKINFEEEFLANKMLATMRDRSEETFADPSGKETKNS